MILLADVPPDVIVRRAFRARYLETSGADRTLSAFLATPDRWESWWLGAVPAGLQLIHSHRPAALWSTHPLPRTKSVPLNRLTGLPWIADFPIQWPRTIPHDRSSAAFKRIEMQAFAGAFHAPSPRQLPSVLIAPLSAAAGRQAGAAETAMMRMHSLWPWRANRNPVATDDRAAA